uniref:C2H2-type domain-containing protein n=1 Tax=Globodera pallida TaxID=36090 RepID=A0A183CBH3_GLOPA
MDDYLTVFENQSNGGTKFESVHSRFERLHVSRKDVQWILCDFCGSVVNKLLYENHIMRHEFIHLTYSLDRFELAEEQKRQKLIRRIQEKEKRQQRKNLCVAGFDLEENTNSSVSLSSSSSDESSTSDDDSSDLTSGTDEFDLSLPGCSNAVVVQPRKRKKALVKRVNTAVVNKKTAVKKRSNRNAVVSSVVVSKVPVVERQQPVQNTTAVATDDLLEVVKMDVVFPPEKFLLPNGHHQPAGVERMQKAEAVGDGHREETEEQRLRKEEKSAQGG